MLLDRLGDVLNAQGKLTEAQQYYQNSLAIRQKLAARDPGNTEWQWSLSVSHQNLGIVLLAQKKVSEALDAYQKSLNIRERLSSQDPSNATWQTDLAWTYERMLPLLFELNRYSEAAELLQSKIAHTLKQPDTEENKRTLTINYLNLSWYELFDRKTKDAIDASKNGLNLNANESMNTLLNTNLAHGYLFSGQYQKAKELYLDHKDNKLPDGRSFKQAVLDDFKEFRKHGINHADMKKIEKLLH